MTFLRPRLFACAMFCQALVGTSVHGADATTQSDRMVKAAFIYNFAKFTEWPAAAAAVKAGEKIVLCAFSSESYGPALRAIDGKPVQGRSMLVRRGVRPDEIKSCHMLYIAEVEERRVVELLRAAQGAPVLTISDTEGFAEAGGMIGLVNAEDRVRIEINNEAVQRAGLSIGAQLLRLARLVKER